MTPPTSASSFLPRLSDLRSGARGTIAAVEGGADTVERLAALGLVPGVALRVLRGGATARVAIGDARLALGESWCAALRVAPDAP
jgi:Fe2+ transport system protein FeoA